MTEDHVRRRMAFTFLLGLLMGVFILFVAKSCSIDGDSISNNDDTLPIDLGAEPFSIGGDLEAPLEPGLTAALDLKISNPVDETLGIQDLVVTVTSVDAPNSTTELPCSVKDFTTQAASGKIILEGGSTNTLTELGLADSEWPQVSMLNTNLNQDGCKGATLSLTYSGSGVKQ